MTAGSAPAHPTLTAVAGQIVLRGVEEPFDARGGIRVLAGNLGRAIIEVSVVDPKRHTLEAPARVLTDQDAVLRTFEAGGPLTWVRDGDVIRIDGCSGHLDVLVGASVLARRDVVECHVGQSGCGRELFASFRQLVGSAESGASPLL
jgi:dihydroxyacid dehydratase/phosphogluconate dehydratase